MIEKEKEISSIFSYIIEERDEGLDIDNYIDKLENVIASDYSNINKKESFVENAFVARMMNWAIQNSKICISHLMMKSTLQLMQRYHYGNLNTLFESKKDNL